ncbi:MAG: hypothetical protein ACLTLZ_00945 [Pseudoruminococcus massiliensis]|mgnify:FL=1|uniref:hypothetical protein n=1 Tax=Pseudoruminococcus massiliensis TaxID=2086583 RepID=UPI002F948E4D
MKVAKKIIVGVLTIGIIFLLCGCSESWERKKKDWDSEYNGGLERTISVYSYEGNLLKTYKGKCDIEENESNKILFDIDGKRVIIYNAVVIAEEK